MKTRNLLLGAAMAAGVTVAGAANAQQKTDIEMWIGVTGPAQELIQQFASEFNGQNPQFQVNVSFRGQYPEQRAAAIAAFRAGNPPHIMQMFDAGTGDMFAATQAIVPVSEVYRRAGLQFDPSIFLAPAAGYYGAPDGTLFSQPLNVSTAVMFYNKDVFRTAGLNPDQPPRTWPELIEAGRQIRASGHPCGFTTTWMAWIMLEQMSAVHDLPLSTAANGRGGVNAVLNFDNPMVVRTVQTLAELQRDRVFDYGGRSNDAAAKFISGECAILLQSSGGHAAIARDLRAEFGVAPLPYWPDVIAEPKNSIIGGASLWVFNAPNRTDEEFRGTALFLEYLSRADVLARFAKGTGFLPATNAAFRAMQDEGFFAQNPGRDVPILQLTRGTPSENSLGYRFGRWTEIRDFFHEEVERALQGQVTAQQAVANAVTRGNQALRQFERSIAN